MLTFTFIVNVNVNCKILKQKINCALEGDIKDLIHRQIFYINSVKSKKIIP
jgi:hypothetical protein